MCDLQHQLCIHVFPAIPATVVEIPAVEETPTIIEVCFAEVIAASDATSAVLDTLGTTVAAVDATSAVFVFSAVNVRLCTVITLSQKVLQKHPLVVKFPLLPNDWCLTLLLLDGDFFEIFVSFKCRNTV